jgi:hypothetical protein
MTVVKLCFVAKYIAKLEVFSVSWLWISIIYDVISRLTPMLTNVLNHWQDSHFLKGILPVWQELRILVNGKKLA